MNYKRNKEAYWIRSTFVLVFSIIVKFTKINNIFGSLRAVRTTNIEDNPPIQEDTPHKSELLSAQKKQV